MEFIETKIFSEDISKLATDSEYKEIQEYLCMFPLPGDVIPGTGGIRKFR